MIAGETHVATVPNEASQVQLVNHTTTNNTQEFHQDVSMAERKTKEDQ